MSSPPAPIGRRQWRVLVIDDEEAEGRWISERLLEREREIECIADGSGAVKHEPDTLTLQARLVSARAAMAKRNGDEFRRICQFLPTVVVLDQFLPDPDQPGDTSTRASLRICELVNDIWDRVQHEPAFQALGWNVCVLMYTGQDERFMASWLDQTKITGRPWFDYATKPVGIPACTPEVAAAEGRHLMLQINALTRGTRPRGARLDVVPELYAGRQGGLLREAIRVAASLPTKPVWIVGRWQDGCEKVVPLVVTADARLEPTEVGDDGLFAQLHQLRRGLTVHPVFALRGKVSADRLAAFCQQADCKFVIVCDEPPSPLLVPYFSTIRLVPLHKWEVGDIQKLFQVRWGREVSDGVVKWLQERLFDYSHFSHLYFTEGETIDSSLLSERCHGLRRETLAIEIHPTLTSASIHWRGVPKPLSMSTFGGISAVAVLRAMVDNAKVSFSIDALVAAMLPFDGPKIRAWGERMKDPSERGHIFRRNAFSSNSTANAVALLRSVVGNPCIEGRKYESLGDCRINWILSPRPNVTRRQ